MMEGFLNLTAADYIYAAITAFVATQLILVVSKFVKVVKITDSPQGGSREADRLMVIKK